MKLSALVALAPTYPEVGATRAALLPRSPLTGGTGSGAATGATTGATTGGPAEPVGTVPAGGSSAGPVGDGAAGRGAGGVGDGEVREAGGGGSRGVTAGGVDGVAALPAGYHHLRYRRKVGRGPADFHVAAGLLHSWRMHRAAGTRVEATGPAVEGETVVVRLPGLRAPCRVVWSVPVVESDAAGVAGFGYGTLPGHPERGEEGFLITLTADGDVWFDLAAFSVAATWPARLAGPVGRSAQRLAARRYATALAGAVKRSH